MTAIRKRQWITANGDVKTAWVVDYRDNFGKRRNKQFILKKEAETWLTGAAWEVSKGLHTPDSQSIKIREATELWLARAEADKLEASTLHQYRGLASKHIIPFIGEQKLNRINRPIVESYRDELLKTRSRAMAGKAINALSSIITEAQRRGLVAQNVAKGVKVERRGRDKPQIEIPTRMELKALISVCSQNELPLILTAVFTGLRASEIRGLRWQDIDFTKKVLSVKQRADLENKIGPPKSEAAIRNIPLPEIATTTLKRWKLACPHSSLDLVFPSETGTPHVYQNLLRRVYFPLQIRAGLTRPALDRNGKPKLEKVNVPVLKGKYGFHALRHAAASGWIEQNIDLKRLQVWMGHSSIQITLDTYGHLIKDADKDAAIAEAAQSLLMG